MSGKFVIEDDPINDPINHNELELLQRLSFLKDKNAVLKSERKG